MSKTANQENFPVASLLLAPNVRQQVMEFYHLARGWDDIADSPTLSSEEKHALLPSQWQNPFLNDLLIAFHQDADQNRYENWQDLMNYCRFSANPVGRFLLNVHGESGCEALSDSLCSVLQILNHLQDCQKDFQVMNRVYLPQIFLPEGESYENLLSQPNCPPLLRNILNICLDRVDEMLKPAFLLPSQIKNKRLRYQCKVTLLCAVALAGRLRRQDPLARRVELGTLDKILIAYKGFYSL
ncbi:MAG: squalene/phytoene synthase family protein [Terasakiella sp.]|uniref:squalene/phytoene synthase family protein n=2 Tax=Terasakiella TaxID=196080 RepID=UPI003AFFA1C2